MTQSKPKNKKPQETASGELVIHAEPSELSESQRAAKKAQASKTEELQRLKSLIAEKEKKKAEKRKSEAEKTSEKRQKTSENEPNSNLADSVGSDSSQSSQTAPITPQTYPIASVIPTPDIIDQDAVRGFSEKLKKQEDMLAKIQKELSEKDMNLNLLKQELIDNNLKQQNLEIRVKVLREQLKIIEENLAASKEEEEKVQEKIQASELELKSKREEVISLRRNVDRNRLKLTELEIEFRVSQEASSSQSIARPVETPKELPSDSQKPKRTLKASQEVLNKATDSVDVPTAPKVSLHASQDLSHTLTRPSTQRPSQASEQPPNKSIEDSVPKATEEPRPAPQVPPTKSLDELRAAALKSAQLRKKQQDQEATGKRKELTTSSPIDLEKEASSESSLKPKRKKSPKPSSDEIKEKLKRVTQEKEAAKKALELIEHGSGSPVSDSQLPEPVVPLLPQV